MLVYQTLLSFIEFYCETENSIINLNHWNDCEIILRTLKSWLFEFKLASWHPVFVWKSNLFSWISNHHFSMIFQSSVFSHWIQLVLTFPWILDMHTQPGFIFVPIQHLMTFLHKIRSPSDFFLVFQLNKKVIPAISRWLIRRPSSGAFLSGDSVASPGWVFHIFFGCLPKGITIFHRPQFDELLGPLVGFRWEMRPQEAKTPPGGDTKRLSTAPRL